MARICIVIAEGTGGFDVGDVAIAKDDNEPWGPAILADSRFRFFHIPGMSGDDAITYLYAPETGNKVENPNLKKRALRLKLDQLPAKNAQQWQTLTPVALAGVRELKPATPKPQVFG